MLVNKKCKNPQSYCGFLHFLILTIVYEQVKMQYFGALLEAGVEHMQR